MFVQAFVAEAPVEGLDVGVLVRLAGFNETQGQPLRVRPCEHRATAELLPVVRAEDLRKSAGDRQAVQDAGDRQSPEGPRRDNRHGLMGGVVDNGQALHDPPIRRAIEDEVRGPDLVATLGAHQGLAVGYRDLLASTALQLEPGLRVQAIDPFVIDDVAGLPQLQIDHPGPIASMSLRQVNDPIPDDRIAIGPWHVPEG